MHGASPHLREGLVVLAERLAPLLLLVLVQGQGAGVLRRLWRPPWLHSAQRCHRRIRVVVLLGGGMLRWGPGPVDAVPRLPQEVQEAPSPKLSRETFFWAGARLALPAQRCWQKSPKTTAIVPKPAHKQYPDACLDLQVRSHPHARPHPPGLPSSLPARQGATPPPLQRRQPCSNEQLRLPGPQPP